ncbi:MAG: hypothetical protein KF757_01530 [Phycisphaeraceae bacterium]|nr:hypothetical protein [Phycisphaeraceae bacterium]MCW5761891.1 hypothetical protein [Phycisphaeraceae bacterium]
MLLWLLIAGVLAGPASTDISETVQADAAIATVCTVATQAPIAWTPAIGNKPLPSTSTSSDFRQRVNYTTATSKARDFEILYGSAGQASQVELTTRNTVDSTPSIQYPDAPGLSVNSGWAFVTFHWPLIWMESVQAGSIGTTSVMQTTQNRVDLYLITNSKDRANPDPITRPGSCPEAARLLIRVVGIEGSVCLQVPKDAKAVLRSYTLERDEHGHVTQTTPVSFTVDGKSTQELPLTIVRKDGSIIVGTNHSEQERFLGKVLNCAYLQGLYDVP